MKGSDAERLAALFLQRQRLILIEKNYRCRFGEIDLIMRDGATFLTHTWTPTFCKAFNL
jgi:putative endonuclease